MLTVFIVLFLLPVHAYQQQHYNALHHLTHPGTDPTLTYNTTTTPTTTESPTISTATPSSYDIIYPTAYPTSGPTTLAPTSPPTTGAPTGITGNPVTYHNGLALFPIPSLYILFYGNWTIQAPGAIDIINEWASNLNGSSIMNILSNYYYSSGGTLIQGTNQTNYLGYIHNQTYPYGTSMASGTPLTMVTDLIKSGVWSYSANHAYMFVFSQDVSYSVICSGYCGLHGAAFDSSVGGYINMGFIGSCNSGCAVPSSPNTNQRADNVLNIVWHELIETVTDPRGSGGWYDSNSEEIADLCQHQYGTTYTGVNGQQANVHLGTKDYILQELWTLVGTGSCSIS